MSQSNSKRRKNRSIRSKENGWKQVVRSPQIMGIFTVVVIALGAAAFLIQARVAYNNEEVVREYNGFQILSTNANWEGFESLGILEELIQATQVVRTTLIVEGENLCRNSRVLSAILVNSFENPDTVAGYDPIMEVLKVRTSPGREGWTSNISHELYHYCSPRYVASPYTWVVVNNNGEYSPEHADSIYAFTAIYNGLNGIQTSTGVKLTEGMTSIVNGDSSYGSYQEFIFDLFAWAGITDRIEARDIAIELLFLLPEGNRPGGVYNFCLIVIPGCSNDDMLALQSSTDSLEWDQMSRSQHLDGLVDSINNLRSQDGKPLFSRP